MTPAAWNDQSLPVFFQDFDSIEALYRPAVAPARDDLSLCFLCLRWTAGDPACRSGIRCEYQQMLDRMEPH